MISRIWITGARGFIGHHLARWLSEAGHNVSAIGHGAWPASEAASWGIEHWINGDISSSNLTLLRLRAGIPDVIMHLAGGSSVSAAIAQPAEDFRRTVSATAELLEWLRKESTETRVVAVSSAAVYGANHLGPIDEKAALRPYSPYGHHKLMMESLCRSYGATYGLRSTVARLFSVYGTGLQKQLLWDLCNKLETEQKPIVLGGTGEELRDWTEIRDVVRALEKLAALASAEVSTFNVGSGVATSVRQVAERIVAAWRPLADVQRLQFSGKARAGDPFSLQANSIQLSALGFHWCVPLEQGLNDYVHWFQRRLTNEF